MICMWYLAWEAWTQTELGYGIKQREKMMYFKWYFKIVSNFTHLTAREITYNNFKISLVVFMQNITTNDAIIYLS